MYHDNIKIYHILLVDVVSAFVCVAAAVAIAVAVVASLIIAHAISLFIYGVDARRLVSASCW